MPSLPFVKRIRATQVVSQHSQWMIQSYKRNLQGSSWPLTKLDYNNPSSTSTKAKTILTNTHKAWGSQLSGSQNACNTRGGRLLLQEKSNACMCDTCHAHNISFALSSKQEREENFDHNTKRLKRRTKWSFFSEKMEGNRGFYGRYGPRLFFL